MDFYFPISMSSLMPSSGVPIVLMVEVSFLLIILYQRRNPDQQTALSHVPSGLCHLSTTYTEVEI